MSASSPPLSPAHSLPASAVDARARTGALDLLLLWTLALAPVTKLYIEPLGRLNLSNLLAAIFVVLVVGDRIANLRSWAPARSIRVLGGFWLAFTLVYLAGYVAMDEAEQRVQFAKAFAVWLVHGSFMLCAADQLSRGGLPLVRRAVHWLLAGFAASAAWAFAQLAGVRLGVDIDAELVGRLPFSPGNVGSIQYYGGGLYRATGLTLDSNHLGVMLCVPLALALTWLRGTWRWALAALFVGAGVLTLSRSGALGMFAALALIAWQVRGRLFTPRAVVALASVTAATVVGVLAFIELRPDLAESVILGRLDVGGRGAQAHLHLYTLIPGMLASSPLVGQGLNSFALLFEQVSGGREGFGPHSHYIRTVVETGVLGMALFAAFAVWLLGRLHLVGGLLAAGIAAALLGTLTGNLFYLTTQILYVPALFALAAAAPAAMGIGYHRTVMSTPTSTQPPVHAEPAARPEQVVLAGRDPERQMGGMLEPLRRYWWLVLAGAALGIVAALVARGGEETRYQATATVYLGQPVSRNGALLDTLSAKAATGIELASGSEAAELAAEEAGVTPARIRQGLSVTAVQSPLASKLPTPPAIMKVTVRDRDRQVAETASLAIAEHLVEETGSFSRARVESVEAGIAELETSVQSLARAAAIAARGDSDQAALETAVVGNELARTRSDLRDAQAELAAIREIEQSRILDEPRASRVARSERGSSLVVAALIGAILGGIAAMLLARRPR